MADEDSGDIRAVVQAVVQEFLPQKQELDEARRQHGELERRVNELIAENTKSRARADEAERSAAVRAELQRQGISKLDLAYRAIRDEISRSEDGKLVAQGGVELRDYVAQFVTENPELLPARVSGGSGAVAGQKGGSRDGDVDLERIRPGMSPEEMERVRQEIARVRRRRCGDCKGNQGEKMATITSANVATAIVKLVAADALPALVGNLVMGNLVNRDYEQTLARSGDTVNVPIPPTLVANNIAEGGTVQTQNPNLGNAQIILSTHAEATFQIPDVTKVLAVPDLLKLYMQPAVVAIAERIETDLLALYPQFTANTAVGTGGTALVEATVDAAETALFKAMVPASRAKYLVVNPSAYSELRQISRFSEYNTVGEAGLRAMIDGAVGKMKDLYIFRSQFVPQTGTSPVTTHNLAFARDAIGLVIRRLPQPLPGTGAIAEYAELGNFGMRVTMSYQPNTLAQQFTVDVLYGTGVLRNSFAVQVNS